MPSLVDRLVELVGDPRKGSHLDRARTGRGVPRSSEWERIRSIPRRELKINEIPDLSPVWVIPNHTCNGCDICRSGKVALRPIQSAALLEAEATGGLFAPIGVGHGKELLSLLLPDAMQAKKAVILTKPRLKQQLLDIDIPRYGKHFKLPLDRIQVISYSTLSVAKSADVLDLAAPDLIIANEAAELRNKSSARCKRFLRYMKVNPKCRFVPLSGTMANRSILNYSHLIELALRSYSPLPHGYRELEDWARALDVSDMTIPPGALLDLCGPEVLTSEYDQLSETDQTLMAFDQPNGYAIATSIARKIYKRKLIDTPGVVVTTDSSVACSLVIEARKLTVPQEVKAALDKLATTWEIGTQELTEASQVTAVARQLACGFYYRWDWPNGEVDNEWLKARSEWNKAVRHLLSYSSRPGMDSPLLVANAADRGDIKPEYTQLWSRWKAVKSRWKPHPPTKVVWLSYFLVDDALKWANNCTDEMRGIVWYRHSALEYAFRSRGAVVFPAGDDSIMQTSHKGIFASTAHRDGKNLQDRYCRNLVLNPPANGADWEQLLGRTHRSGQLADEVYVEVSAHHSSLISAVNLAKQDAWFVRETEGQPRKLLDATWLGWDK